MMSKRIIHPAVTLERVIEGVQRQMETFDNPGFCVSCGEETDGCEPDMVCGPCDYCGKKAVYGAAELLFHL
jgi:hypothetical protein